MKKAWNINEELSYQEMAENKLVVKLCSEEEHQRVLEGVPWTFANWAVIAERWRKGVAPADYKSTKIRLWLQVHNVPAELREGTAPSELASLVGRVIKDELEDGKKDFQRRKWDRFRIEIDVNIPIRHGVYMLDEEEDPLWIEFKYERLPNFCYRCGRLSHELEQCTYEVEDPSNRRKFGPQLRAEHKQCSGTNQEVLRKRGIINVEVHDDLPAASNGDEMEWNPTVPESGTRCLTKNQMSAKSLDKSVEQCVKHRPMQTLEIGNMVTDAEEREDGEDGSRSESRAGGPNNMDLLISFIQSANQQCGPDSCLSGRASWMEAVNSLSPQIIGLLETKMKATVVEGLKFRLGFHNCFGVDCWGRSGGLALFWDDSVSIEIKNYSHWHIDAVVREKDEFRLTLFYGDPVASNRKLSWNLLRHLHSMSNLQWVILGDFNEILCANEAQGGRQRNNWQMENFRRVLNDCNLSDIGFSGDPFTFSNHREGGAEFRARLDRVLANEDWRKKFSRAAVTHVHLHASDHQLIVLETERKYRMKKKSCFDLKLCGWITQTMARRWKTFGLSMALGREDG
ncbi:hypothetical protein QQ045_017772 [Rhodiola kirilowii]